MLIYYLQLLDTPEEKLRFEQIYLNYRGLMYHVADGVLRNRQDAEDAVHNAFLRILKAFPKLQDAPAKDLAPQIVVITKNEAISLLRKRRDAAPWRTGRAPPRRRRPPPITTPWWTALPVCPRPTGPPWR